MRPNPPPFNLGYRRSLDGVRGVAILLVLLAHGGIIGDGLAFMGVNTFFVLSGFLITCLLVEEYDKTGRISFGQFYMRRALRLLPALMAMLALFVTFSFIFDPYKRAVRELYEALFALFYSSNWTNIYHVGRHISLAHTWSLSVEEQFYIFWPVLLLLVLSRTSRSSMLCLILLGVFLAVVVRIGLFVGDTSNVSGNILPVNPDRLVSGTDIRADSLLLGCFAGTLVASNMLPQQAWFMNSLQAAAALAIPGLLVLGTRWVMSPFMIYCGWFLESLLAMFLILHLVAAKGSLLHWVLENRFLVLTGKLSYGLYIWHFPILKAMEQHHLPWQNLKYLIVVVPVAVFSYYVIELPCLRLKKKRFEVV
jgi:peptidoglycan/LPS O-acetylase OafA/YrhL